MTPTTPQKDWRFELNPLKDGLLIDFFTQHSDAARVVDPNFSVQISDRGTKVTIWGARIFSYVRNDGEPTETRSLRTSKRPVFVQELKEKTESFLYHLEVNFLSGYVPEFRQLLFVRNELEVKILPRSSYVEVWRAEVLEVHSGPDTSMFYRKTLEPNVVHYREDEAILAEKKRKVLPFTAS